MVHVGDALLHVTEAYRINYEILGNSEPELHAHIVPRYLSESDELRPRPPWAYDWVHAPKYSRAAYGELQQMLGTALRAGASGAQG
jgi:diadenosine tetraphosphate (Ap4A) HIT family hydrolase